MAYVNNNFKFVYEIFRDFLTILKCTPARGVQCDIEFYIIFVYSRHVEFVIMMTNSGFGAKN